LPNPPPARRTGAIVQSSVLVGTILALGLCVAVATRSLTLGSIEGRWTYESNPDQSRYFHRLGCG
jgi:hypothetical protein